jgi:hypothetical protein
MIKLFRPRQRMRASVAARIAGKLLKLVDQPPKEKQPMLPHTGLS